MRWCLAIFAICIWQLVIGTYGEGKYSVIGPGTIHSGKIYKVAVGVHHTKQPSEFKIGITGPAYNEVKTVNLKPDEVQNVEFDVPVIPDGKYNLTAEGVTNVIFKNTTQLNYVDFKPHISIQTDKGKYKPGDVINFRVLFLDENLRPAEPKEDTFIYIEDAKRNRIKKFENFKVVSGVYTGKFEISEFPILGSWYILVDTPGTHYPKTAYIEVEKYVLPKYVVSVESTDRIAVQDGDLHVVVRANYTFDKPFNGIVTAVMEMGSGYYMSSEEKAKTKQPPVIIKKTDMVNGKAKFDVDVRFLEEYMPEKRNSYYMTITATVEEQFTGVQINASTSSTLYPYRYQISCVSYSDCSTFHADKEFELPVKVSRVDSLAFSDTKNPVKLIYTEDIGKQYFYRGSDEAATEHPIPQIENKTYSFEAHLNATNIAVFKITLPDLKEFPGYDHFYRIDSIYAGENHDLYKSFQYRKPKTMPEPEKEDEEPKAYFYLTTHYPSHPSEERNSHYSYSSKIGGSVTITLNSSTPVSYFIYNVVGRATILENKRVDLPTPAKVHNLTITSTFLMAPSSHVYVYYVDNSGEFHYAETYLNVEVELQNKINITVPAEVKPGEEVSLKIKTAPNSFVGLLAVDQSVLLLRDNNDIEPHYFNWILSTFSTTTPHQGGYSRYPGDQSGVVTLTNADYFYNWTNPWPGHDGPMRHYQKTGVFHTSISSPAPAQDAVGMAGGPGSPGPQIQVRKDFSETWIFDNIESTSAEEFVWKKKIPDTITSWVLSGFSINPEKGLGVVGEKSKLKTFQPFFITTRLPYSVKRGEVFNIPALVFNYLEKDLDVEVTLDNTDGEFDFTEVSNEVINEEKRTKTVNVKANSAAGVAFMIRPKVLGNILLKFTAVSPIAGDAIHKSLKVVPEGVTEYANRAFFVNLKDTNELKDTFELDVPAEVVPDSEHAEFAVVGDLLGPVVNNLERLVRMPGGCGEQVTSAMMANLIVFKYLQTSKKLTPDLESRIKRNLEGGYQRLLGYQNKDGSFSAFGYWLRDFNNDKRNGSTWLTAYVVRSLGELQDTITINPTILSQGVDFLRSKQAKNGSFVENGDVFFASEKQHLSLTASVLLALQYGLADKLLADIVKKQTNDGIKYVVDNWEESNDLRAKAYSTYTLHKLKDPKVSEFLPKLRALAKTEDDRMWWSDNEEKPSHTWWRWVFTNDIEVTSYILLTLLDTETVESALPIVRWLVSQRNSFGGFGSTQDTVVGLTALTSFISKSGYEPAVMDIEFSAKGGKAKEGAIKVNEGNALLLQSEELPQSTRAIDFHAKGKGAALVQISYQYNVLEKEKEPAFNISIVINKDAPKLKLELDVCVEYVGEGPSSNMAILEASLPSGYVIDEESLKLIEAIDRVRLVETKHSETVVVVYFESLPKKEARCVPVQAFKTHAVALQKPAPVVVYDYYDTTRKATEYYQVGSKLCDICEGDEECVKACNK